jgi:glycosyltransferase involved in cell wall biosynthesis
MIALLGQADSPTDAVEDYCRLLGGALGKSDGTLEILRVPWPQGWRSALGWLGRESRNWRGQWVLVQYTVFAWSRRGFPLGFLAVLRLLRRRGARLCLVFHDPAPSAGNRLIDRLRRRVQLRVLRGAYRLSERSIFTLPLDKVNWLSGAAPKAAFIPVGANFPNTQDHAEGTPESADGTKTVAVYGVTGGTRIRPEVSAIAHAVLSAAKVVPKLRLVVFGRGVDDAAALLRAAFANSSVALEIYGVLSPEAVERRLREADVLLFVRGGISSRRGSAIAGIVCGLPVLAYKRAETAAPITTAGVVLVPERDEPALAKALAQILTDDDLRVDLRRRSEQARDLHFSWDAIAAQFRQALAP